MNLLVTLVLTLSLLTTASPQEQQFVDDLNAVRCAAGARPLVWNDALGAAADFKSHEFQRLGYFGHVSPTGEWPNGLLRRFGYPLYIWLPNDANNVESNAAAGPGDDLLAQLLASPGHRAHLLGEGWFSIYREIGVSLYDWTYGPWNTHISVAVVEIAVQNKLTRAQRPPLCNPHIPPMVEKTG
jgi:uncharacterized protein YkwD